MSSAEDDEVRLRAADQVYDGVAGRIFSGELRAGARLRIRDLAEDAGTSVMPVREAIQQLVKNGLAVSEPHRGARVREFTTRELIDIYDARSILEIEAVRRGAARVSRADIATMRAACERMYRAVVQVRVNDALDEDEKLLRTVYAASGNPVIMDLIEQLWIQCRAYKVMGATAAIQHQDASLWEPQPALIEAIERGDTTLATAITRESIAAARTRLEAEISAPEQGQTRTNVHHHQ
ncbi:GntR family transcriptional regulator [Nocardioides sp.]|uniref:GntR family transcriptional regulator n=1 Tax=Nocardioides sp. TaxID=35761 RepID=UPI001997CF8F|nr:GntR family transcriptional regulator [Nocardioides sp.]MBC7279618.1 GntR family transcriptional regulator [Nocardioides sp.]